MKESIRGTLLKEQIKKTFVQMEKVIQEHQASFDFREIGIVSSIGKNIIKADGLPNVKSGEIVRFKNDLMGMVFNLNPENIDIILLDEARSLSAGDEVQRTNQVMDIPVGESLIGRVIDPVGRPLDQKGRISITDRKAIEQDSPAIMDRAPVHTPLQTGLLVVDSLVPIGRGQRELILGDRQTGKTGSIKSNR